MRFRLRVLVFLALALAALAPVAVANAAQTAQTVQTAQPAPDSFKNVPVSGTLADGGTFAGTLDVNRFIASSGNLVAVGRLTGTLTQADGTVSRVAGQLVRLPVTADPAANTCRILHLNLAPTTLNLLGLRVHLSRVILDITAHSGPGQLLGNLLCAIAHLLDGGAPTSSVAAALNQVTRVLTGPDVFRAVPVTGQTANGDVFVGTLKIVRFATAALPGAAGTGLVAIGRLNGTLTQADGTASSIVGKQVQLPLMGTGSTCKILHLVLGPLRLNLLGLVVHLNRVVLDITALKGPGNLLGNLLCAIAHLLDGTTAAPSTTAAATAADQLNVLKNVTQLPQNLPVTGTFGPGQAGLMTGTLDIQRFRQASGQLFAVGRMSGALIDAAGNVTRFTDQLVTLPVSAPTRTCRILHLVLGPLHLNLLGLVVNLNRVVLDITAVAAPGNLLGNLLCDIAHLLDGGSIPRATNRLNSNLFVLRLLR